MGKILLFICESDEVQGLIEKLTLELTPSRTVVLSNQTGENTDEIEFRKLPEEASEDFILETIRELSDVFESELTCCVAGTPELSLMLGNAMTIGAAFKDRLCQVQTDPFKLTDIHFARLCYLFQDRFNRLPITLTDTMDLANLRISRHIDAPELFLSTDPVQCIIGECELSLQVDEFILYWLLAIRCKKEVMPIHGEEELLDEFQAFIDSTLSAIMPEISEIREGMLKITEADILKLVDSLTAKIKDNIAYDNGRDCALPVRDSGVYGITFPPDQVICPRNY